MGRMKANTKKEMIMGVLEKYQNALKEHGLNVIGLFLYGRQNYGTDAAGSEINAFAVYIPDAVSFAFQEPARRLEKFPEGHAEAMDIRLFARDLMSGDYKKKEVLLTPYRIVEWAYFKSLLNTGLCESLLMQGLGKMAESLMEDAMQDFKRAKMEVYLEKAHKTGCQADTFTDVLHQYQMLHHLMHFSEIEGTSLAERFGCLYHDDALSKKIIGPAKEGRITDRGCLERIIEDIKESRGALQDEYAVWKANYEGPCPKESEQRDKQEKETARRLADWVESAFTVAWTHPV